jgi:hypothetical protein
MVNVTAGMVLYSITEDWHGGLACKINEALYNKFKPNDIMSYVDVKCDLNAITMTHNDDPSGLCEQISDIKNGYNSAAYKVDEEQLQSSVLENTPDSYHGVLTVERRAKGDKCTTMTAIYIRCIWRN